MRERLIQSTCTFYMDVKIFALKLIMKCKIFMHSNCYERDERKQLVSRQTLQLKLSLACCIIVHYPYTVVIIVSLLLSSHLRLFSPLHICMKCTHSTPFFLSSSWKVFKVLPSIFFCFLFHYQAHHDDCLKYVSYN